MPGELGREARRRGEVYQLGGGQETCESHEFQRPLSFQCPQEGLGLQREMAVGLQLPQSLPFTGMADRSLSQTSVDHVLETTVLSATANERQRPAPPEPFSLVLAKHWDIQKS